MITRSRKLSLKLVYQLTHKTMICRSKCRPLNSSSIGTNGCISSSSPATHAFAPDPFSAPWKTPNGSGGRIWPGSRWDEMTYAREEALTRLLGRRRHPQARRLCGCAVWTPKGYDWVYRRFLERQNADHHLIQASPRENTHLPGDFYARLEDSYAA